MDWSFHNYNNVAAERKQDEGDVVATSLNEDEALFLEITPVSDYERRRWLYERLDSMDANHLALLYPSLEKIFSWTKWCVGKQQRN